MLFNKFSDGVEVWMSHGILAVNSHILIVNKHFAHEVDGFWAAQILVLLVDETCPRFLFEVDALH